MANAKQGHKRIEVQLDEKLYNHLRNECEKTGLTMAEFLRRIIENRNGTEVTIDFLDIDQFTERQDEYIRMIKALLPIIAQSGNVYPQDMEDIRASVNKMDELICEIWRYVVNTRTRMYDDVRNKICKKVVTSNYTVRSLKGKKEKKEKKCSDNLGGTLGDGFVN